MGNHSRYWIKNTIPYWISTAIFALAQQFDACLRSGHPDGIFTILSCKLEFERDEAVERYFKLANNSVNDAEGFKPAKAFAILSYIHTSPRKLALVTWKKAQIAPKGNSSSNHPCSGAIFVSFREGYTVYIYLAGLGLSSWPCFSLDFERPIMPYPVHRTNLYLIQSQETIGGFTAEARRFQMPQHVEIDENPWKTALWIHTGQKHSYCKHKDLLGFEKTLWVHMKIMDDLNPKIKPKPPRLIITKEKLYILPTQIYRLYKKSNLIDDKLSLQPPSQTLWKVQNQGPSSVDLAVRSKLGEGSQKMIVCISFCLDNRSWLYYT